MPTMEELRITSEHTAAMRKFRQLLVFVGSMTAPAVETLTDANGAFVAIPDSYLPVGLITKDGGVTFPRNVERSTEQSVNHGSPTRRDTDSDDRQVKFTAQQTTKTVLELAYGLDLSAARRKANGEVGFAHPELPDDIQRRLLILGMDPKWGIGAGKFFPTIEPTDFPEIGWGPTALTTYEITADAMFDDALGYSMFDIPVCGPGALTHAAALGFPAPVAP